MWCFNFKRFPVRLCVSGRTAGNVHDNPRTFCPFHCTAWNQWPLSNPANWQWSSLCRRRVRVKWLISSQSHQFKPPILKLSTDPFAVRVIHVTLWHVVNVRLHGKLQNNLFSFIFHQQNFYIDATVWLFFCHEKWPWSMQSRRDAETQCLLGDKLLRRNDVAGRQGLIQFPTLYWFFSFFYKNLF